MPWMPSSKCTSHGVGSTKLSTSHVSIQEVGSTYICLVDPTWGHLWSTRVRHPTPFLKCILLISTYPREDLHSDHVSILSGTRDRNQVQTSFKGNKKELMTSWKVLKSPKVEPPSDMAEPSPLAFPGRGPDSLFCLGLPQKAWIGLPSSHCLSPCFLDPQPFSRDASNSCHAGLCNLTAHLLGHGSRKASLQDLPLTVQGSVSRLPQGPEGGGNPSPCLWASTHADMLIRKANLEVR